MESIKKDISKKRKEYNLKWNSKHRLENRIRASVWREKNPDYYNKYFSTETGLKNKTKSRWKNDYKMKFTEEEFEDLYYAWQSTDNCNNCLKKFKNPRNKHMDHDHTTGLPRAILCMSCNITGVFADDTEPTLKELRTPSHLVDAMIANQTNTHK